MEEKASERVRQLEDELQEERSLNVELSKTLDDRTKLTIRNFILFLIPRSQHSFEIGKGSFYPVTTNKNSNQRFLFTIRRSVIRTWNADFTKQQVVTEEFRIGVEERSMLDERYSWLLDQEILEVVSMEESSSERRMTIRTVARIEKMYSEKQ